MFYLTTQLYGLGCCGKVPFRYREKKPAAATTWATLFRLAARGLLYGPSHRHDSNYHGLCCTSRETLAEMRNN